MIIISIAFHHDYIFAGSDYGVYRTNNEGATWAQVDNGINYLRIDALETIDTLVFAGSSYGVFRSVNNGASWSPFGLADTAVTSLLNMNGKLFAGTLFGIYLLESQQSQWQRIALADTFVSQLIGNNSTIFAGTNNGVFLSDNDYSEWKTVNSDLNTYISALAVNDSCLFAGTWAEGIWRYPLSAITTDVSAEKISLPQQFVLKQNYPNPFNPATTIEFEIPVNSFVKLELFDLNGRKITDLINEFKPSGGYKININLNQLASGVYYYKLTKKMLLIR